MTSYPGKAATALGTPGQVLCLSTFLISHSLCTRPRFGDAYADAPKTKAGPMCLDLSGLDESLDLLSLTSGEMYGQFSGSFSCGVSCSGTRGVCDSDVEHVFMLTHCYEGIRPEAMSIRKE